MLNKATEGFFQRFLKVIVHQDVVKVTLMPHFHFGAGETQIDLFFRFCFATSHIDPVYFMICLLIIQIVKPMIRDRWLQYVYVSYTYWLLDGYLEY